MNEDKDSFDKWALTIFVISILLIISGIIRNEVVKGNNILDYCNSLGYKDYVYDPITGVYCFDGYTMSRTTGEYVANNVYYLNETELKEAKK